MSFKFKVSSLRLLNHKFSLKAFRHKKFYLLLFVSSIFLSACSIPNLEKPECVESREIVKQFYSFHFGNDMNFNLENLKQRKKFLSENLFEELKVQTETAKDYFTQTDDYPKAFRVGGCEVLTADKTILEILIFWKTETRTEQRTLKVETIKTNGEWLIDKVENK